MGVKMTEGELPVPIKRIEMYFNDNREPVKNIKNATFKDVTTFDDNGEVKRHYSVEIIDGIDPEIGVDGKYIPEDEFFKENDEKIS